MIDFLEEYYFTLLFVWMAMAIIVFFVLLFFRKAEYGRFYHQSEKRDMNNRWGWIVMESPAVLLLPLYFYLGPNKITTPALIILLCYQIHYIHRTLIFPFFLKTKSKRIPLEIVSSAFVFNLINTFFIGFYFGFLKQVDPDWLYSAPFIIGLLIFLIGAMINMDADYRLIRLRKTNHDKGYFIPKGGFFRWISCPNYFGEIIEWAGFAILTWSLPGLAFALWTVANLFPRAISVHRWYNKKFENYPSGRKAILPFVF